MTDHEQYNLPDPIPDPIIQDWISSDNVVRTEKNVNIKNRFIVNDNEVLIKLGQSLKRMSFSGSNYTAAVNDYLIGITSLALTPTIGLPRPKDVTEGKNYIIKDEAGGAGTTTITVRSNAEETIDGAATSTITTNFGFKSFYTDGSNWFTK